MHLTHAHEFLFDVGHNRLPFNVEKEESTGKVYVRAHLGGAVVPGVNHSPPASSICEPLGVKPHAWHGTVETFQNKGEKTVSKLRRENDHVLIDDSSVRPDETLTAISVRSRCLHDQISHTVVQQGLAP